MFPKGNGKRLPGGKEMIEFNNFNEREAFYILQTVTSNEKAEALTDIYMKVMHQDSMRDGYPIAKAIAETYDDWGLVDGI